MKKIFFLSVFIFVTIISKAQIYYEYDNAGNRIKRSNSQAPCPTLSWQNPSVCTSGNTTVFHVEVAGLGSGQIAEFSIDGGAWVTATIGNYGYEYSKINAGSTSVSFLARPQGTTCNSISGSLAGPGSTCSGPTCPTINWQNPSVCTSGTITKFHAEVSGLTGGQVAEFSIDGGAWMPANFGSNGIDYYKTNAGTTSVSFLARVQGTSCTPISGALSGPGSTCSTPICTTLNWQNPSVCTSNNITQFHAEVSGLGTGQIAEFSIDGGAWVTANYGVNGINYNKLNAGSTPVSFLARAKYTGCPSISGALAGPGGSCPGARIGITQIDTEDETDRTFKMRVFPNPVKDDLTLELNLEKDEIIDAHVYNVGGVLLHSHRLKHKKGFNRISINFSLYPEGSYILNVLTKDRSRNETFRIIKIGN